MSARPKVYLAGPGVFRPNADEIGARLKAMCAEAGLKGLWPGETAFPVDGDPFVVARKLFDANVKMMRDADAIIADISPFRGPHMDCGTAWELGFANALGMDVFAYTAAGNLASRIWTRKTDTGWRDAADDLVEDFCLVENLMIGCSVAGCWQTAEQAIRHCAQNLLELDS